MSKTPVAYDATEPQVHPPSRIIISDYHLRNGFSPIPNAFLRRRNLSCAAKCVYSLLLSYGWRDGSCHPGGEALCDDLGISDKTLKKAMDELRDKGLIAVKRMGLGRCDQVTINPLTECDDDPPDVREQNVRNDDSTIGDSPIQNRKNSDPESEDFRPTIGESPTLIRKTSLRKTSKRKTTGEDGGSVGDFPIGISAAEREDLEGVFDALPRFRGKSATTRTLLDAIRAKPDVDWPYEARKLAANYEGRRKTVQSITALTNWVANGRSVQHKDGYAPPPQASWGCTITDKDRERAARSERLFLERQAAAQAEEASHAAAR